MAGIHHDIAVVCRAKGIDLLVDEPQPWLARTGHLHPLVSSDAPASVVEALRAVFVSLGGDEVRLGRARGGTPSAPDLVHVASGCIIEIDELPNFTTARRRTFGHYPPGTVLGYDLDAYREVLERHRLDADAVLAKDATKEFPFAGGRQAQRAYGDVLRDLLAPVFTGHPVIRIDVMDRTVTGIVQVLEQRLAELTV